MILVRSQDETSIEDEKAQEDLHTKTSAADQFIQMHKYDIVIANILLNPLLALADEIVSHAKVGATVGLSGVLHEQVIHCLY